MGTVRCNILSNMGKANEHTTTHTMEIDMKVSTKKDKNAAAVVTDVTIVRDDPQAQAALADQALIVKVQGIWRKNGIPAQATLKYSEYAPGSRHAGAVDYTALTPEERKALIEKLQAIK